MLAVPGATGMVLSRRNLEDLIEQLDSTGSGSISRFDSDGTRLVVIAEENAVHYVPECDRDAQGRPHGF